MKNINSEDKNQILAMHKKRALLENSKLDADKITNEIFLETIKGKEEMVKSCFAERGFLLSDNCLESKEAFERCSKQWFIATLEKGVMKYMWSVIVLTNCFMNKKIEILFTLVNNVIQKTDLK